MTYLFSLRRALTMPDYSQETGPEPTPGVWDDAGEPTTPEELLARGQAIIDSGDVDKIIEWGLATAERARAVGRPDIAERAKAIVRNLAEKQAAHQETNERLRRLLDS